MLKPFSFVCAAVLFSTSLVFAADVAPRAAGDHGPAPGAPQANAAPPLFEVQLRGDTTAGTVMPAMVAAAHARLVTACESTPGASVRVFNPLASGEYADVACAAILDGGEPTGESRQPLTSKASDGPIGESQQALSPLSLLCALGGVIAARIAAVQCERWRGPNSELCNVGNFSSNMAWAYACWLI
jgi:hypothetical protein